MASVNKVIIVGNLGKDPEMRYTQNNTAVCNFTVATTDNWTDKQSGDRQERTEWHNIVAWSRLGEICGQYLHKGKQVYIEGRLQTRKWQDRDGRDRYSTEVVADNIRFLSGGGQGASQGGGYGGGGGGYQQQRPQGGWNQQASAPPASPEPMPYSDDEEIPF